MDGRKILCVALRAHSKTIEDHLGTAGWDVTLVKDLATARRIQAKSSFVAGLLILDEIDAKLSMEIEQCVKTPGTAEWIGIFPAHVLDDEPFRDFVLDHFFDYHTHPVDLVHLTNALTHAQRRATLRNGHGVRHGPVDDLGMVGQSPVVARLRQQVRKVAAACAPVLIGGESGSGKELAAQAIHRCSLRASGPFVAVNCGAIAPTLVQSELFGHVRGAFTGASADKRGLIEMAHGGTIFLDEIADLPLELQVNLLRFLQEKTIQRVGSSSSLRVDARVVAASHIDLAEAVACGKFREDLFYRLDVLSLMVPTLRERKDDIPLLAQHFYQRCAAENKSRVEGFSKQAVSAMMAYDWPGNVRELFNRVQRAVVMTDRRLIGPADLGMAPAQSAPILPDLEAVRLLAESEAIRVTLSRVGRNVTHAARELGISRMTLYRLMEKHGIAPG